MSFIRTEAEFEAAKDQVAEYINSDKQNPEDDKRIEMLIHYIEEYVLKETGSPTMMTVIAVLPEEAQKEAIEDFVKAKLGRTYN